MGVRVFPPRSTLALVWRVFGRRSVPGKPPACHELGGARAAAMRRTPRDQYDAPAPDATTVRYLYGVIALAAEQRCKRNVPPQRTLELAPRHADTWHAPRRRRSRAPASCVLYVPEAQGGLPEPSSTMAYRAQAVLRPCCVVACRRCGRARSTTPAWWASMGSGRASAASRPASTTPSSRRSSTGAPPLGPGLELRGSGSGSGQGQG